MEYEGDAQGGVPSPLKPPLKIRINKQLEAVKEKEFAVSPSTPLLSTAIEENGWVCGQNDKGQLGVGGTADSAEPQVLQIVRRWAALSLGESHSAGVSGEGECYTWGQNQSGQLGWAAGASKDVPMKMDILRGWDVRAIACGGEHTVAITPDDVISWGRNAEGQTGQGERAETDWVKPRSLKPLQGLHVTQVVCGRAHTLCVTATSQVFAWGCNSAGQLGLSDTENRRAPCPVDALWAMPVAQLAAGDMHSAALTISGFLFTWGSNEKGQLGLPAGADLAAQAQRTASEKRRAKRKVNQRFLSAMSDMGINVEQAELALSETGNVGVEVATEWLFSVPEQVLNKHLGGEPSTPTNDVEPAVDDARRSMVPKRVPLQAVRSIAAGGQHTVAVTDSQVYAWGCNSCGQLGTRTFRDKTSPTEVMDLAGKGVSQVACGAEHTLFLCGDGAVYGCGSTQCGQLPYLKFSSADGSEASAGEQSGDEEAFRPARNEVTKATRLKLPFLQERGGKAPIVTAVEAGGNGSAFLTRAHDEFPEPPGPHLWERLRLAIAAASDDTDPQAAAKGLKPIVTAVEMVFGSAAALSATFGSKEAVGIDVQLLNDTQERILNVYKREPKDTRMPQEENCLHLCASSLNGALYKATNHLLDDLHRNYRLLGTPERAQVMLAAVQSPLLTDKKHASLLIPRLCNTILTAPSSCRHILVKWWSEYPADLLEARVVKPLQQYLTAELSTTKKLTQSVMNTIKVLAKVDEANQLGRQLPPDAFYNYLISEKLDVEDHYIAWRQAHDTPQHSFGTDGPFSFCSYPFLLSPRAKSKLLHTEARFSMTHSVQASRLRHSSPKQPSTEPEELVVPRKTSIEQEDARLKAAREEQERREQRRQDRRRRERHTPLRQIWNQMFRNGDTVRSVPNSPSTDLPVDERRMLSREVTNNSRSHPSSPSEASGSASSRTGRDSATFALARQGSMNLPKPEDSGVPATHPDMAIVRVRRNHILEDGLSEIARQIRSDLYKPLRVHFIGEDGIDAGGVKKEFFQLLVTELLSVDYGMLVFLQDSGTYWFNSAANDKEAESNFVLLGVVLGLAVYNAVLLDFPMPQATYRKLLGQQCTLREIAEMDPMLGKSLNQLLTYEGPEPVETVFCQNFTASQHGIGEVITVPLCEGGEDRMVTEENRREYVDLYADFILNKSVHVQFEGFARGFMMVVGGPAVHLFSPMELERLVSGNPILDFKALQANARYDGGYSADHRTIKWLWEVVGEFVDEEQRHFLKFFTGSDRAPIGGLGNLRCIIQRDGTHSSKLPTSHTCFNTLLLPSYKSKAVLGDRLRLAIMNSEGFGLE